MTELLHWRGETYEIWENEPGAITILCLICRHRSGRAEDRLPPACRHCGVTHAKLAAMSPMERGMLARPKVELLPIIPLPPTRLEVPFIRLRRRLENYRRALIGGPA